MTNATVFYELNVAKQREVIEEKIQEAQSSGDPVIMLPFDTYPVVEDEMSGAGWIYLSYTDKADGKKCAAFYPKQYQYADGEN